MTDTEDMTTYLAVCEDCCHWQANGEMGDHLTEAEAEAVRNGRPFIMDCDPEEGHCDTFWWLPCDACGSTLGGHRHRAVPW